MVAHFERSFLTGAISLRLALREPWSGAAKWERSFIISWLAKVFMLFDHFDGLFVVEDFCVFVKMRNSTHTLGNDPIWQTIDLNAPDFRSHHRKKYFP